MKAVHSYSTVNVYTASPTPACEPRGVHPMDQARNEFIEIPYLSLSDVGVRAGVEQPLLQVVPPPAMPADAPLLDQMRDKSVSAPELAADFADEELANLVTAAADRLSPDEVARFVNLGRYMDRRMGYMIPLMRVVPSSAS